MYALRFISGYLAAFISGVLLCAAFPAYDYSLLAWISLVPLLLALARSKPSHSFVISFFFGVVFYTGFFYWIFDLTKYSVLHHSILGVYLCPLLGLFGWLFSVTAKRMGLTAAFLLAPFAWIAQEYIRSNLSFLSLPWALLAHSQYENPIIIQMVSITGTYGLSFLIVLVNAGIAALLYPIIYRSQTSQNVKIAPLSRKGRKVVAGTAALLMLLNLIYGGIRLSGSINGDRIKVSLVQGNIEQSKKWDPDYAPVIMQVYSELTRKAARDNPALIIWPETATPKAINRDPRLYEQVKQIARSVNKNLLIGSSQLQKFKIKNGKPKEVKYTNSAYLISPGASNSRGPRYDKIRLLPFGEYLPYRETLPWALIHVPDIDHYLAGKEYTIFKIPQFDFAVTICWENLFPALVRQFVQRGAQVMVNITNEAWFGETAAPYQFLSMSVFRAVENSIFMIRCANTGISCFIDPRGRITGRLSDSRGKEIFIRGFTTGSIIPVKAVTVYNRYGDWFAGLCGFITLVSFLLVVFKRKPNSMPAKFSD